MAKTIVSGVHKQKKSGLPTYCYCNYRLLRAINLANACPPVQMWGCPFNLEWLSNLASEMKSLVEFANQLGDFEIERLEKGEWQQAHRTTRIDLNLNPPMSNTIRRLVWSSKEDGNGLDGFLIYWFRSNERCLPFVQSGNKAEAILSDPRSPSTYRIRYTVNGEEFYIVIEGAKTVRKRKRKPTGRTTQNSQSIEQAETAMERKPSPSEVMSKMLQSSQKASAHEGVNQSPYNLEY